MNIALTASRVSDSLRILGDKFISILSLKLNLGLIRQLPAIYAVKNTAIMMLFGNSKS
jgi:hypothetical protein